MPRGNAVLLLERPVETGIILKTGLTKKHWFGYMFGDWGGCMTFTLMGTLFTMYCTNALGIDTTLLGPAVFIFGSWAAFKFVWNITPEKRVAMAAMKAAKATETETN